jgi:hypothetical protein
LRIKQQPVSRGERRFRMSNSEELARQERRRQIIERLNQKEEFFGLTRSARRVQMSEEEVEV